jgi:dephospho-CoA kinase
MEPATTGSSCKILIQYAPPNGGVFIVMLKVGLTGGIGSGKSMVASIFAVLGIPVYFADEAAKRIQQEDPEVRKQIIGLLGDEAYQNGILNRTYVSSIVFSNKTKLEQLNAIVHPATMRDAENWLSLQTTPYAIKEAALIFESGSQRDLDFVIGVTAPIAIRIQRTMARDSVTEEQVRNRMEKQISDKIKMRLCDAVIVNDEKQLLLPQVLELHQKLITLSRTDTSSHLHSK